MTTAITNLELIDDGMFYSPFVTSLYMGLYDYDIVEQRLFRWVHKSVWL
jgi:hypothetical protein